MSQRTDVFKRILDEFEDEDMRAYCEDMIDQTAGYIFTIPSSTSYKYHNKTQCQPGGQLYHILMVGQIMNYLLGLDYIKAKFPKPKQRDCLRIAALLHDNTKCGFDGSQYTVHEHPILCMDWIINTHVEHDISDGLKRYIGELVASHSGQWTSSNKSKTVLPAPENDEQFLVHLCDYLGSRSNLDMIYTEEENAAVSALQSIEIPSVEEYELPFGKYKGFTLLQIQKMDPQYISWAKENMEKEPVKTLLKEL